MSRSAWWPDPLALPAYACRQGGCLALNLNLLDEPRGGLPALRGESYTNVIYALIQTNLWITVVNTDNKEV